MEATEPVVKTHHLTKRFSHVTALDCMDLEVNPGDVLALLGANGSGKSTAFKLLLNVFRPSSGTSTILGTPSRRLNGRHFEKIAHISEDKKLPKWMSVRAFLKYCTGFYPEWDHDLCKRLVVGLQIPERQKIKHLSRGQLMKLAVASTVPAHPKLLLLDEPFSGLDVETRAQISDLLKGLASKEGLAIILTTHDVEEIEPVANRIAMLEQGELVLHESLDSYLGRHRILFGKNLRMEDIPKPLHDHYSRASTLPDGANIFTGTFDDNVGQATLDALAELDIEVSIEPMNIRQILTAKSLSVL